MITRYQIQQAKAGAIQWFDHEEMLGSDGTVSKCAAKHVRGSPFSLDFKSAYNVLDHIEFVYDDYWCHWAATDGVTIWLNTWRPWTHDTLLWTLIHEALHGIVLRDNVNFIPEPKEHKMMLDIDTRLV